MAINLPHKALVAAKEVRKGVSLCTFEHPFSKKQIEKEVPVSLSGIKNWTTGTLIQNAMPNLTADERELFITGGLFDEIF